MTDSADDFIQHDHIAHVYIVYWPDHGVLKIGESSRFRWNAWRSRGMVEIAALDTCCKEHAQTIESYLHRVLSRTCQRAFAESKHSKPILGDGVGFSECFVMPRTKRWGEALETPYDYERAYGLVLPADLLAALDSFRPAWHAVPGWVLGQPIRDPEMSTKCGRCPAEWSGAVIAHCGACHESFSTPANFDRHRAGQKGGRPSGECYPPVDAGLVVSSRGYWSQPGRAEESA